MSNPLKPDRYACRVVLEPDGKHAYVELVDDASGAYMRACDLGLTQEDVELLRRGWHATQCGDMLSWDENESHCQCDDTPFLSLADRIEALLPGMTV